MPNIKRGMMGAAGSAGGGGPTALFTWGDGNQGALGDGTAVDRSSPVQVGDNDTWTSVQFRSGGAVAIKSEGTLWTWGNYASGKLGDDTGAKRSSPVQIGSLTDWAAVSENMYNHCFTIKTDGTLWGWGKNTKGQLGVADTTDRSSPTQVGALTTWALVTCGYDFTHAVKTDGTLWAWGRNNRGQLGSGNTTYYSSPVQIGALTDWAYTSGKLSGRQYGTHAVKTDGTLWGWGRNDVGSASGSVGDNTTTSRSSPVQIGALTTWATVSTAESHCHAIKTDGTLWGWGNNSDYGKVGNGSTVDLSSPVQIGALTDWSKISAGWNSTTALKTGGTIWAWGRNIGGVLGDGTSTTRSSPVQIGALTDWDAVFNGGQNAGGLKTE